MDVDRPNATNTPHTVDAGHWQVELGVIDYSYVHAPGSIVRTDSFTFGQFNVRVGILTNLEINALVAARQTIRPSYSHSSATGRTAGFGDTLLGGKLNFWGNEGGDGVGYTALAIQPQFKIPTAGGAIGNRHWEASVAFPFLLNLREGFHLGLQSGASMERNPGNTGYVAGFSGSVSLDRAVFGKLDVYLEYGCHKSAARHVNGAQMVDFGCLYPITRDVMIDAGLNIGLTHASKNVEVQTGISLRR